MPLTLARSSRSPAFTHPLTGEVLRPATRSFDISYGTCEIKPHQQSCPVPVSLHFFPVPSAPVLAPGAKTGEILRLRGIDATVEWDGGLWVETADVTFSISVFAATPEERRSQAVRIINQFEGANAKARHITKASDFTPKGGAATP